jgi:hypothetical protein
MESSLVQITDLAIQTLSPILLALSGWLAHRLIKAFEIKTKLDVPAKQEAQIDAWIAAGIRAAEEKAYQAVKAKSDKITGPEKLETAIGFVLGMAEKNGWVDWTKDLLKAKVEALINVDKERPGSPAGQ